MVPSSTLEQTSMYKNEPNFIEKDENFFENSTWKYAILARIESKLLTNKSLGKRLVISGGGNILTFRKQLLTLNLIF